MERSSRRRSSVKPLKPESPEPSPRKEPTVTGIKGKRRSLPASKLSTNGSAGSPQPDLSLADITAETSSVRRSRRLSELSLVSVNSDGDVPGKDRVEVQRRRSTRISANVQEDTRRKTASEVQCMP